MVNHFRKRLRITHHVDPLNLYFILIKDNMKESVYKEAKKIDVVVIYTRCVHANKS